MLPMFYHSTLPSILMQSITTAIIELILNIIKNVFCLIFTDTLLNLSNILIFAI